MSFEAQEWKEAHAVVLTKTDDGQVHLLGVFAELPHAELFAKEINAALKANREPVEASVVAVKAVVIRRPTLADPI